MKIEEKRPGKADLSLEFKDTEEERPLSKEPNETSEFTRDRDLADFQEKGARASSAARHESTPEWRMVLHWP